jgi:hypothetical protein
VVQASLPAHIYLFQRAPNGAYNVLFPDPRIGVSNPIPAKQQIVVPPGGGSYLVDDKDLGLEKVFVVASLGAISSLDAEMTRIQSLEIIGTSSDCRTRALTLEPAAPGACTRQRGLVLDRESVASSSLSATTEAADDSIVRIFSFNHTR